MVEGKCSDRESDAGCFAWSLYWACFCNYCLKSLKREPLRYVNRNVHLHTVTIFMMGPVTVVVCGVHYY